MKTVHLTSTLPESLDGLRLDQALAKLFPQFSRSQHQTWIKAGKVTIDDVTQTSTREKVHAEQSITIDAELVEQTSWEAQDLPLDIIFEDETLIVINKPIGLVVHPGAGNPDTTLVNALLHYDKQLATLPRAGLIHRLDKDTSGLLVIARTLEMHQHLVQQLQERDIHREYLAIVNGVMTGGGTVDAPIGRHPRHRTKMAVTPGGKPARTHYRVRERFRAHTYVDVKLETGRTHQIRVHMAHIHYPLVGDHTYYKGRIAPGLLTDALQHALNTFPRQALHAWRLALTHPLTKKEMQWEADVPEDMKQLLELLRDDAEETRQSTT